MYEFVNYFIRIYPDFTSENLNYLVDLIISKNNISKKFIAECLEFLEILMIVLDENNDIYKDGNKLYDFLHQYTQQHFTNEFIKSVKNITSNVKPHFPKHT